MNKKFAVVSLLCPSLKTLTLIHLSCILVIGLTTSSLNNDNNNNNNNNDNDKNNDDDDNNKMNN